MARKWTFKKLSEWFINKLDDKQITKIYEGWSKQIGAESFALEPDEIRSHLIRSWNLSQSGVGISNYMGVLYQKAVNSVKDKSLEEIRSETDDMLKRWGLRTLVLSLMLSGHEYKLQFAGELIDKYKDQTALLNGKEKSLPASHPKPSPVKITPPTSLDDFSSHQLLEAVKRKFGKCAPEELTELSTLLDSMLLDIDNLLASQQEKAAVMENLKIAWENFEHNNHTAAYCGWAIDFKIAYILSQELSVLQEIEPILNSINEICATVAEIQNKPPLTIEDDERRLKVLKECRVEGNRLIQRLSDL